MLTPGIEGGLPITQIGNSLLVAEQAVKQVIPDTLHFLSQYPWLIVGIIGIAAAIKATYEVRENGFLQKPFSRRRTAPAE